MLRVDGQTRKWQRDNYLRIRHDGCAGRGCSERDRPVQRSVACAGLSWPRAVTVLVSTNTANTDL
jgi:hypothetical protein